MAATITISAAGAFIVPDGDVMARPFLRGSTVSVDDALAARLVAEGSAVLGDTLPEPVLVPDEDILVRADGEDPQDGEVPVRESRPAPKRRPRRS